jgi:hypothetical protein
MARRWLAALGLLAGTGGCVFPELPDLHAAAREDDVDRIATLVKAGAELNRQDDRLNRWTPLMHAVHRRARHAALALIAAGADVNARGGGGTTALIMAAGYGETDVVQALLKAGADPRAESEDGQTALWAAAGGMAIADITDGPPIGGCFPDTVAVLLESAPEMRLKKNLETRALGWFARSAECRALLTKLQAG